MQDEKKMGRRDQDRKKWRDKMRDKKQIGRRDAR